MIANISEPLNDGIGVINPLQAIEDLQQDWYDLFHKVDDQDSTFVDILTKPFEIAYDIARVAPSAIILGNMVGKTGTNLFNSGKNLPTKYIGIGLGVIGGFIAAAGNLVFKQSLKLLTTGAKLGITSSNFLIKSAVPAVVKSGFQVAKQASITFSNVIGSLVETAFPFAAVPTVVWSGYNLYQYEHNNPGSIGNPTNPIEDMNKFSFLSDLVNNPIGTLDNVFGVSKGVNAIISLLKGEKEDG